jgi:hypothetical protein
LLLLGGPVENVVGGDFVTFFSRIQEGAEVVVIWFLLELEAFSVVDENSELVGKAFAEDFGGSGHFFLQDHLILGLGVFGLHVLPGQDTSEKVHDHIANGLDIISSRLLDSHVSIDTGISRSASQFFSLLVWNVLIYLLVQRYCL